MKTIELIGRVVVGVYIAVSVVNGVLSFFVDVGSPDTGLLWITVAIVFWMFFFDERGDQ